MTMTIGSSQQPSNANYQSHTGFHGYTYSAAAPNSKSKADDGDIMDERKAEGAEGKSELSDTELLELLALLEAILQRLLGNADRQGNKGDGNAVAPSAGGSSGGSDVNAPRGLGNNFMSYGGDSDMVGANPAGGGGVGGSSAPGRYDGMGSSSFNSSGMPQLAKYGDAYEASAHITGIDPHIAAAKHMREASGREDVVTKNPKPHNANGVADERFTYDVGPSQISRGRVEDEIIPWVRNNPEVAKRIKEATGKDVEDLDINNAKDNIILGQLELKMKLDAAGGDMDKALYYYQSGGLPDVAAKAPTYAQDVIQGAEAMRNGRPYTGPGA